MRAKAHVKLSTTYILAARTKTFCPLTWIQYGLFLSTLFSVDSRPHEDFKHVFAHVLSKIIINAA